jgi:hypothetical protein
MKIARIRKDWPRPEPPAQPTTLTVPDVLQADTDEQKERMIRMRSEAFRESWKHQHAWIRDITEKTLYGSR